MKKWELWCVKIGMQEIFLHCILWSMYPYFQNNCAFGAREDFWATLEKQSVIYDLPNLYSPNGLNIVNFCSRTANISFRMRTKSFDYLTLFWTSLNSHLRVLDWVISRALWWMPSIRCSRGVCMLYVGRVSWALSCLSVSHHIVVGFPPCGGLLVSRRAVILYGRRAPCMRSAWNVMLVINIQNPI